MNHPQEIVLDFLMSEVKKAIDSIKIGKAAGPDKVSGEINQRRKPTNFDFTME